MRVKTSFTFSFLSLQFRQPDLDFFVTDWLEPLQVATAVFSLPRTSSAPTIVSKNRGMCLELAYLVPLSD